MGKADDPHVTDANQVEAAGIVSPRVPNGQPSLP